MLAAYTDPGRRYHGVRHLAGVLARLEELARAGTPYDRTAVQLAAWFHDAIYDGERDAEERSAAWAEDALPPLVAAETVAEVARLVRVTETHDPAADDVNGCALSDADLAVLAGDEEAYDEYAAAVRTEYGHIDDDAYRDGRAAFLTGLADRDRIFRTAHALAHWEGRARANIARELAALTA